MSTQAFYEYAKTKQPQFAPLRGKCYAFIIRGDGTIGIYDSYGGLTVPANRVAEVEQELRVLLGKHFFFSYKKKKAKNISTLLR